MTRLIVSLLAQADTAYIVKNLASKSGYRIAAKYAADFEILYERLIVHPDSGSSRPAVGQLIRIGIILPYIVIYEYERVESTVTILRIVHGKRKITDEILGGDY